MLFHLAALLLAPVFLMQGKWVRWVTPQLPEPEGAREGVWGAGPDLRLMILGDSAAAGVGVASQAEALSGRLVAELGEFFRVSWKLVAQSGHDSGEVLEMLQAEPPATFDVVVVSVGVNDVTGFTAIKRCRANLLAIANVLTARHHSRLILFSSLPPMHAFPALPQPLRWWLGERAKQLNALVYDLAQSHPCCRFVNIEFPFEPHYIAGDGFHPGQAAYAHWASQLVGLVQESWTSAAIVKDKH